MKKVTAHHHFIFMVGSTNYVGLIFEPLARRSQLIYIQSQNLLHQDHIPIFSLRTLLFIKKTCLFPSTKTYDLFKDNFPFPHTKLSKFGKNS